MRDLRPLAFLMAAALAAIAMWPVFVARQAPAAAFTPAPLTRDYLDRDKLVRFYEHETATQPADQIKMRMLAQLYMQRFREQYDLSDITRAERLALHSIALQPQGNTSAEMTVASALLSYHDFRHALRYERAALAGEPSNQNAAAQIASLQMELGEYGAARSSLGNIRSGPAENPTTESVRARYDELTGNLAQARRELERASRVLDSDVGAPAYDRSWYHLRLGQLAAESGNDTVAFHEYQTSLDDFPNNAITLMWRARLERSRRDWTACLRDAQKSANLYPLPQALGYEADAQRATGDQDGARATDALIDAEQRLFDVQGINDRLLANYYAQRGVHLDRALAAARSDYRKRGDEIYADDTMAWVLSKLGRWNEAYTFAERATRTGIEDPVVQFHAGVIAAHTGHIGEARRRLTHALKTDPQFDPFDAPVARSVLAGVSE